MAEGEYPTAFPLKHAQKDVRLALAAAQEKGLSLPVASAANGQYMKASSPTRMRAEHPINNEPVLQRVRTMWLLSLNSSAWKR